MFPTKTYSMEKLTLTIRFILIFIFSTTFIDKITDYQSFKQQLFLSPLIPPGYLSAIGILTIVCEALILCFLIVDRLNFYGMLLSSFLLSLFGFYLLFLVVNYKFNKPCGCGFIFSFLSYNQHILLNFLLSFSAAGVILFNKNYLSQSNSLFFNKTSNAAE